MSYPFVASAAQYGRRDGPVRAFVVHMAEGGGTVGFLSRPNERGVSVHYVIEYTGRIVQMTREADATGSINPNDLRTTNDAAVYGVTVRKAVMRDWDHDPNAAGISCEVGGFASIGPNSAQHGSLRTLIRDVRSRFPTMGLLGHRDFQDYKACPGKLIHWDDLGGHGPAVTEDEMPTFTIDLAASSGTIEVTTPNHFYLRFDDPVPLREISLPFSRKAFGLVRLNDTIDGRPGGDERKVGYLIRANDGGAAFVLKADVGRFTPASGGDTSHTVVLAVDGQEKARVTV